MQRSAPAACVSDGEPNPSSRITAAFVRSSMLKRRDNPIPLHSQFRAWTCYSFRSAECRLGILHPDANKKGGTAPLQPLDDKQAATAAGSDPPVGVDARRYAAKLRDMSGLRAQLARVTRSAEVAADLLHDAIVTALQKLQSGEISDEAHLDGYVYRVALNH